MRFEPPCSWITSGSALATYFRNPRDGKTAYRLILDNLYATASTRPWETNKARRIGTDRHAPCFAWQLAIHGPASLPSQVTKNCFRASVASSR